MITNGAAFLTAFAHALRAAALPVFFGHPDQNFGHSGSSSDPGSGGLGFLGTEGMPGSSSDPGSVVLPCVSLAGVAGEEEFLGWRVSGVRGSLSLLPLPSPFPWEPLAEGFGLGFSEGLPEGFGGGLPEPLPSAVSRSARKSPRIALTCLDSLSSTGSRRSSASSSARIVRDSTSVAASRAAFSRFGIFQMPS